MTIPVPQVIETELLQLYTQSIYGNKDTDPVLIGDLTEFFSENYAEFKAIKQVVAVAATKAGLDSAASKLANKQKITSTEFAKAFAKDGHRKLDYPIKDKKFEEGKSRIMKVASTQLATFLAQGHPYTKKAFLKEMGYPTIVETVDKT